MVRGAGPHEEQPLRAAQGPGLQPGLGDRKGEIGLDGRDAVIDVVAIQRQAGLEAARTRNASGFTKSLDEAARDKDKALAGASAGIAGEDVMAAKQLNQQGAAGEAGLYGTDVGAQLKAMGQQNEDIGTAVQAGQTGWLQNMEGVLNTGANVAKSVSGMPGI